ncbi:MAG: hypothetical protein QM770_18415 [Tepidisphaeraceae bacterium]
MHAPTQLRTEYLVNPVGLDARVPRLFWQMSDTGRGAKQTKYQVVAGRTPGDFTLWDSGVITSDRSTHIDYAGPAPKSRERVYWRVKTWDGAARNQPGARPRSSRWAC